MKKKSLGNWSLVIAAVATLGLAAGCAGKKSGEESDVAGSLDAKDAHLSSGGDSDSGQAMGLETVNFEYDSYNLTGKAKSILSNNAKILKSNAGVKIQVEGHCDDRGSIQYNLALGEKRAAAVRRQLGELGVAGDRVSTISFGKERPIDPGSSEAAYAKNRRANFVITSN